MLAAAALTAAYGIAAVKHQVVCEGNSETYGWPAAINGSGNNVGNVLPTLLANDNVKVVNFGVSGNLLATGANIAARAATVDTATLLPNTGGGRNIFMMMGGVNDTSTRTKAQMYADMITVCTGILALNSASYTVELVAVIPVPLAGSGRWQKFEDAGDGLWAMMRDTATFLTACSANTGQAYEGLMSVLDVPALSSVFADHNAAGDTTYYYTDGIHPNELGTATLAQLYADKINAMGLS